jgi:hypothetical protein
MLQLSQGVLGTILMMAGIAAVYASTPPAGQSSGIGEPAIPFVSVLYTMAIFGGAMLLLAAVLF